MAECHSQVLTEEHTQGQEAVLLQMVMTVMPVSKIHPKRGLLLVGAQELLVALVGGGRQRYVRSRMICKVHALGLHFLQQGGRTLESIMWQLREGFAAAAAIAVVLLAGVSRGCCFKGSWTTTVLLVTAFL